MASTEFKTETPHPHAKYWTVATVIIVLVAIALASYYVFQTRRLAQELTQDTSVPQVTQSSASSEVSPTPTQTQEVATTSSNSSAATVANELNQINVSEIEQAIAELQDALKLFKP